MYPGAFSDTYPNKPAVIVAETGAVVTFAELEANSIRAARYLARLGLRPGDHLAVVATNRARVFDLYWAAMRSGLYLTMVNWHLTPNEVAYIVDDCDAKAVVVDGALEDLGRQLPDLTPGVEHHLSFGKPLDGYQDLDAVASLESAEPMADQPRGTDMLYSSGTTGQPKGIKPTLPDRQVHERGDRLVETNKTVWGVGLDTVAISPAPLYHSAPLRFFASVHALGGTVVLVDRFDAETSLLYIEKYGVTHSQWVPTMLIRMLKLPEIVRTRYDVTSMRVAIHAAAPCPVETKLKIIEWWGPILWEFYSSTEFNGMTIVTSEEWLSHRGTVGKAVMGIPHVCGSDGHDLAPGEIGTIYFERDALPFEYHNAPEKTVAAQHPEHPTWTTTGDLGYVDEEGYMYLTDRDSFMIISGGVNIYPQEIENVLVEHPKVFDAGVVGLPDAELGETVTAVVMPLPGVIGDDALRSELRSFLEGKLARFKIPRRFEFSDDLPRTPTGKLVKRKLKDSLLDVPSM